ncbi:hypothetical protein ACJJJB_00275 (plasmid) [Microbulbifer sp. ANSA001]|uniref:hypothetical protein n=1 Tax=Microbulbifer sp. ANSA001 TaxID=3243358 RepID=UPI004041D2D1
MPTEDTLKEATALKSDIRHLDCGTAELLREAYCELSSNLASLTETIEWINFPDSGITGITYLNTEHLKEKLQALQKAKDDLEAFGLAL